MKTILLAVLMMFGASACMDSATAAYTSPLWGDPCDHDRPLAPNVVAGCTHASDGSGDSISPGRSGLTLEVGICAADDACRPLCHAGGCPSGSSPTMIAQFCYCDVPQSK